MGSLGIDPSHESGSKESVGRNLQSQSDPPLITLRSTQNKSDPPRVTFLQVFLKNKSDPPSHFVFDVISKVTLKVTLFLTSSPKSL